MILIKKRLWEINKLRNENLENLSCKDIGNQALIYIKENFTNNELSLNHIAEELHISQPYLTKIIKEKTGTNFTDYLNKLRIEMSIKLLLDKKIYRTINEISYMVGYSSQHYFSRALKIIWEYHQINIEINKLKDMNQPSYPLVLSALFYT